MPVPTLQALVTPPVTAAGWPDRMRALAPYGLALVCLIATDAAHAQVPADPFNYSRASSFTYYGAGDGAKNGLLKTETIEPNNAQLCVTTTYDYDAYGNKVIATTANCAGATGLAPFPARAASSVYAALPLQSLSVNGATYPNVAAPAGIFATSATNALNQSETRQYDPRFGIVTGLTGPNLLATSWQFDDFGRKVKELRADGTSSVTLYCYLAGSGLDATSNSAGCPTPAAGETPARAIMLVHSEPRDTAGVKMGPFTRVYSDRLGRPLRSVTESFDGANQAAGRSAALIVQDTEYNASGAKVIQTQPYFLASGSSTATGSNDAGATKTDYDVLGRPKVVYTADPNGSQASVSFGSRGARKAAKQTIVYTGLNTLSTNDKGQTRKEEKNPNGQSVRVTDATGAQIAYQHDAFGNLLKTKDALQNLIQLSFDIRGRKTQMSDPDTGLWKYQYNALGELVWQQSPNQRAATVAAAQQTTLAYDKLGRMTRRTEPEFISTWSYDTNADGSRCMQGTAPNRGTGKLCESSTTHGVNKKLLYDSLGRPINARTTLTNGPSFASAVSYDGAGRIASQTYPTGVQVGFSYTSGQAKGFLEKLTLLTAATVNPLPATPGGSPAPSRSLTNAVLWQAQVVNAWGRAETQLYGNGVSTQALMEAATGRTTDLRAGTGNTVLNQHYSWDSLNNLTGRSDNNGDGTTGAVSETFTYTDSLNRLSSYKVSAPAIPNLSRSVTLQYNALGMLLSKSDVGNYSYAAQGAAAVRPHALQSVSGAINSSYSFDANGNVTGSSGNTKYSGTAYTSFNLPDSQSGVSGSNGTRYTWLYDESHARIKEVRSINTGTYAGTRTTWNLHPDNQGGLGFESEVNVPSSPNGHNVNATSNRHYLSVGGQAIGVLVTSGALPTLAAGQTAPPVITSISVVKLEYWHKDQLGSLITTTDHWGSVTQRYAYDPFGKRRYTNGSYDAFGNVVVDWSAGVNYGTERGFTGHQQLDEVGLVHMNGRIFDATLGVFLQGDPLIQDPGNLQNYNRYGYCYNNPLGCTDPSGFGFMDDVFKRGFEIARVIDPVNYYASRAIAGTQWGYTIGSIAIGAASVYYCSPAGAAAAAGCNAAGQTLWAGFAGKSFQEANKIGVVAGLTTYAFAVAGDYINGKGAFSGGTTPPPGQGSWQAIAVHAAVGCGSSVLGGGRCQDGALSAAFSEAVMGNIGEQDIVIGTAISAIVGGTAAELGGGKFSNGAVTGAFGYLFNELLHQGPGTARERLARSGYVGAADEGTGDVIWKTNYPNTIPVDGGAADALQCTARCIGRDLYATGGQEQWKDGIEGGQLLHSPGSAHYDDQAVDFRGLNVQSSKVFSCSANCGYRAGWWENWGDAHWHFQLNISPSGKPPTITTDPLVPR